MMRRARWRRRRRAGDAAATITPERCPSRAAARGGSTRCVGLDSATVPRRRSSPAPPRRRAAALAPAAPSRPAPETCRRPGLSPRRRSREGDWDAQNRPPRVSRRPAAVAAMPLPTPPRRRPQRKPDAPVAAHHPAPVVVAKPHAGVHRPQQSRRSSPPERAGAEADMRHPDSRTDVAASRSSAARRRPCGDAYDAPSAAGRHDATHTPDARCDPAVRSRAATSSQARTPPATFRRRPRTRSARSRSLRPSPSRPSSQPRRLPWRRRRHRRPRHRSRRSRPSFRWARSRARIARRRCENSSSDDIRT